MKKLMMRFAILVVLSAGLLACAQSDAPLAEDPLEGTWRMVGLVNFTDSSRTPVPPQESLFLFTEGYYSMGFAYGAEASPPYSEPFRPTEAEILARYWGVTINAGEYEVAGSTLTIRPAFAIVPDFVGGVAELDFEVEDDTLHLTWRRTISAAGIENPVTAAGGGSELTLVRVR